MHAAVMASVMCLGEAGEAGLQEQLDAVRNELRALQRQQAQGALDSDRAEAIRAMVQDALMDGASRPTDDDTDEPTEFLGNDYFRLDATGTEINSADGNFRYHLNVQMQLRFIWNHREDLGDTQGFENRRTRFIMDGHAFGKEWRYALQLSRPGGVPGPRVPDIEDAWVGRVFSPQVQLKMGQFRPYFTREELMISAATTFMDRSALNSYFRSARSRGISLEWETEHIMWRTGWFDGISVRSPTTAGGAAWNTGSTANLTWNNTLDIDWAFASRFDWKLDGSWRELRDYTPWLDMSGHATNLGVAVGAEQASPAAPFPSDPWMLEITADALHKQPGWSVWAWGVFRRVQSNDGQSNQWGALVQANMMLAERWETALRYSLGDSGADSDAAYPMLSLLELNLSHYFHRHSMKVQLDVGYSFEGLSTDRSGNGFANSGLGLLPDAQPPAADVSGQVYVGIQYQVLF